MYSSGLRLQPKFFVDPHRCGVVLRFADLLAAGAAAYKVSSPDVLIANPKRRGTTTAPFSFQQWHRFRSTKALVMVSPLSSDGSSFNVDPVDYFEAADDDIRPPSFQRQLDEAATEVDELRYDLNFQRAHANWTQQCYNEEVARVEGLLMQVDYYSLVAKKRGLYALIATSAAVVMAIIFFYREVVKNRA